jgi:hypothetical protein
MFREAQRMSMSDRSVVYDLSEVHFVSRVIVDPI